MCSWCVCVKDSVFTNLDLLQEISRWMIKVQVCCVLEKLEWCMCNYYPVVLSKHRHFICTFVLINWDSYFVTWAFHPLFLSTFNIFKYIQAQVIVKWRIIHKALWLGLCFTRKYKSVLSFLSYWLQGRCVIHEVLNSSA